MGNTDSVPVVSQGKSLVQFLSKDSEGAKRTQENFLRGCPIVSQGTSAVQAIRGDKAGATETQLYFLQNLSNVADSLPVVGHIKGGVHFAMGDKEKGENSMKSASRTIGVIGGGIGGVIVGGPPGAVAGGIAGGAAADGLITGVTSLVEKEYRPYGHVQCMTSAITGKMDAGSAFDWAMMPLFDGLAGRAYGKVYQTIEAKIAVRNFEKTIEKGVAEGKISLVEGETPTSLAKDIRAAARELKDNVDGSNLPPGERVVSSTVFDAEGNTHSGVNFKFREATNVDAFHGDVPSAQQILENRLPGRAPPIRGASLGEPSCAEIHALHEHHSANGLAANPTKTVTLGYDGTSVEAVPRCSSCTKVGNYVDMGNVPTDGLKGTSVPLDSGSLQPSANLLVLEVPIPEEDEEDDDEHLKKE